MAQAARLIGKVKRGMQSVAYGNPLYKKILSSGEVPKRLHFTPADPWPGDAQAGQAILSAQGSIFDRSDAISLRNAPAALRNLRAIGTDAARAAAAGLIDSWLAKFDDWHETEWQADSLGARIAAWIGFYDFYSPAVPPELMQQAIASLYRQWKHLVRTVSPSLKGVAAVQAARGLIYGGLNFPEGDNALGLACELLKRQMEAEILPDGGHISRNPSTQLHMLRHLIDIRNVLNLADIRMPEQIGVGIASLIPGVKFFRHGDGGLALFHGSVEESPLLIDAVLTQAVVRGRVLRRLPDAGYERIMAGRSLLMIDASSPPHRSVCDEGHAGLMSFEFSCGKERIIVNCGAIPARGYNDKNAEWRNACASTAAHSTVTVEDTNACDIDDDGGVSGRVNSTANRFEEPEVHGIEMAHDGYLSRYGLIHNRTLRLSSDGENLSGLETLQGRGGLAVALRWHLHPSVQVSLLQGGKAVLLRTHSGAGWRLSVEGASLGTEASIYCGSSSPRRTMQIKASATTRKGETAISWLLSRVR